MIMVDDMRYKEWEDIYAEEAEYNCLQDIQQHIQ